MIARLQDIYIHFLSFPYLLILCGCIILIHSVVTLFKIFLEAQKGQGAQSDI